VIHTVGVTATHSIGWTVRIISVARHAQTIAFGRAFLQRHATMKTEADRTATPIGWNHHPRLPSAGAVATALLRLMRILGLVGFFLLMFSVAAAAHSPLLDRDRSETRMGTPELIRMKSLGMTTSRGRHADSEIIEYRIRRSRHEIENRGNSFILGFVGWSCQLRRWQFCSNTTLSASASSSTRGDDD
jgi:hypothetical protein